MKHLFPKGLHEAFSPEMFRDRAVRPTIGILIVVNGGILMVNPRRAGEESLPNYWTIPQEKVEFVDGNIVCAIRRGIQEEFGYTVPDKYFYSVKILGDMENRLPLVRRESGITTKVIRFVGIALPQFPIRLNLDENRAYKFVSSWGELDEAMSEVALRRVRKYTCTCEATLRACTCRLLPWGVPPGLQCEYT